MRLLPGLTRAVEREISPSLPLLSLVMWQGRASAKCLVFITRLKSLSHLFDPKWPKYLATHSLTWSNISHTYPDIDFLRSPSRPQQYIRCLASYTP